MIRTEPPNGFYYSKTITVIGRGKIGAADVPKLAEVPELGSHRIAKLASLQLSGQVRGFIFRSGAIGLEWIPGEAAKAQGYERETTKAETLREAVARLFDDRNQQLKKRIEAIEAAELLALISESE